jgi:hypothetical protein
MDLLLDSTVAKLRVEEPLHLFVAYEPEADVTGRFRDVLYPRQEILRVDR